MRRLIVKLSTIFLVFATVFSFQAGFSTAKNENPKNEKEQSESNKNKPSYAPGEIVVKFNTKVNPNKNGELDNLSQDLGSSPWQPIFSAKAGDELNVYKKKVQVGNEAQIIKKLSQKQSVEYAELNQIVSVDTAPNDPYYSTSGSWGQSFDDLWGIKKIQSESAWDSSTGSGVVVAVVDSGADYNHPDLAANIWQNPGETGLDANGNDKKSNGIDDDGNGYIDDWHGWDTTTITTKVQGYSVIVDGEKTPDNDPMDDAGHGTHVSGTIAAVGNNNLGVIGVAPSAKIMPVKFLTQDGVGLDSDAANALVYAADNGARVINNSWGGSYSRLLHDAIKYAYNQGAVIVASAGNTSADNIFHSPSGFPETISVAATDNSDALASFSSYGKVDLAAPGVDILSTKSSLDASDYQIVGENYKVSSGTSMASPHITGAAALVLANDPTLNNEQVRQVLEKSADDLGSPGFDIYSGFGRINLSRALAEQSSGQSVILSPVGNIDGSNINITGTADAVNFLNYSLEYGAGDSPSSWVEITSSQVSVINSLLGIWNTSGLDFGRYSIKLTVTGSDGNQYQNISRVDLNIPLQISSINADVFSPSETIINWNTNREAFSWIEYGENSNYNKIKYPDSPINTEFAVQLLDLKPNTTYHYRILAEEFAHQVSSEDLTFTTPEQAFSIQNIQTDLQPHQVTISWQTDIPTTGLIQYNWTYWQKDLYYTYREEASDPNLSSSHSITLSNLDDNMEYIFIIKSQDQNGSGATSSPANFTTPRGQYPQISNFSVQNLTENSVNLFWDTDIPSSTAIRIGGHNCISYYDLNWQDDNFITHHEARITGLRSATTYYFNFTSTSSDSSVAHFQSDYYTTPETTHITNIQATTSNPGATITWTTDIPTYTTIYYDTQPLEPYNHFSYIIVNEVDMKTGHIAMLDNLNPNTVYYFVISSFDSNYNFYLSTQQEFTTLSAPADTEPPTGSITYSNGLQYTNQNPITLRVNATDNVGVESMQFSSDGATYSDWEPYRTYKIWDFDSEGQKNVYVKFKDYAGNVSEIYSTSVTYDATPPQIFAPQIESPTEDRTPTWTWQPAEDNLSGTRSVYYFNLGTSPGATDIMNNYSVSGTSYTYSNTLFGNLADGTYYAFITVLDNAGNRAISDVTSVEIKDMTAPTGSISINNGAAFSTSATVTLNLFATDNTEVSEMQICVVDGDNCDCLSWEEYTTQKLLNFTSEGFKTVNVKFKDAVGNISEISSASITIDFTAPTGSILINNGNVSTNTRIVTLNLTASDNLGGSLQMRFSKDNSSWTAWESFFQTKSWNLANSKGAQIVYVQYRDSAGNIATYSDSINYSTSGGGGGKPNKN